MATRLRFLCLVCFALLAARFATAQAAPFDLAGPNVDVHVERAGKTLPIAAVPNLLPGDRLWIHPDLPNTQSARYLMIVAFLRGATNPPPENWFTRAETWNKKVHDEGIFVIVPQEAEQALIFLAPETGGDFNTLRNTVRGRPGVFVRAAQDLGVASLDRARLDKYLVSVQEVSAHEPDHLESASKALARSLSIKLDPKCFDLPQSEQAACLTAHTDQLVLNDGHSQTMVSSVTAGATVDLVTQLSATPTMGAGYFSPYVGAIVDMARILDNLHTAEYQYIPALAVPKQDALNLKLNNPPSFRNPKSVIVIGLPAVQQPQFPPLRAVDPKQVYCMQKPDLVLAVDGAPLVFATEFAHDTALHVAGSGGQDIAIPVTADALKGGYVLDQTALNNAHLSGEFTGELRGAWGFHSFTGPSFHFATSDNEHWKVASSDQSALIVGREDTLHLDGESNACVADVTVANAKNDKLKTTWKAVDGGALNIDVPLQDATPGVMTVTVKQYGENDPTELKLQAYAEAGHLSRFTMDAGDSLGTLNGTRLDEVSGLELNGVHFTPGQLQRQSEEDALQMSSPNPASTAAFQPGQKLTAQVSLKDGRTLPVSVTIDPPRPKVELISKSVVPPASSNPVQIHLSAPDELPLDAQLNFSLKSDVPQNFPRTEKIEVATGDDSLHTTLDIADGSLTMADAKTVVANLDPGKALGNSAFGAIQFRPISANGATGDWQQLANLVRLPNLTQLKCPKNPAKQCVLSGTNLFLIDSVASDPQFTNSVTVPEGFSDLVLTVPHPDPTHTLYIKLRDDPQAVNSVQIPVSTDAQQASVSHPAPVPNPAAPPAQTPAGAQPAGPAAPAQSAPPTTTSSTPSTQPSSGSGSNNTPTPKP